ncbi:MAG: hypothetical protein ABGW82_13525 [Paracoccus sp. (in: a-proteobacteria)]
MRFSDVFLRHGRGLEWMTSALLLVFAITLALPGDTLAENPGFAGFLSAGLNEAALALPLSWIALLRMAGLVINGAWRRSPLLRMIGAVLGAGIFAFLAMIFALPWCLGQQPALGIGTGTCAVACLSDLLAAYRTGADAGHSERA